MEIAFNHQELADLYEGTETVSREFRSNQPLINQYIKTINRLRAVDRVEQLHQFHGLNYKRLSGDRDGYSSVRINQKYRLIFEEVLSETEPIRVVLFAIEEISNHYD